MLPALLFCRFHLLSLLSRTQVLPARVQFGTKLGQSQALFSSLQRIRTGSQWDTLDEPKRRIIEGELRDAEHAGVGLTGIDKERFNDMQQQLAQLSNEFNNNLSDATKAFQLRLDLPEQVAGIPPNSLE